MKNMKTTFRAGAVILMLLLCLALLVACGKEEKATCKITFEIDGQLYTAVTYTEGKVLKLPQEPAKEGYLFDGWYLDRACTQPLTPDAYRNGASAITVYAGWVNPDHVGKHSVEIDLDGRGTHETLYIKDGERVSGLSLPNVPGYTVTAWYTDAAHTNRWDMQTGTVSADMTLYAVWGLKNYTATFTANGETVGTSTFTMQSTALSNIPAVPERAGYTAAWESYTLGLDDIIISAVYTPITYTVTYVDQFGVSNANPTSYTVVSGIVLSPLSHPDYLFVGWSDGDTLYDAVPPGKIGHLTLTAVWEKRPADITYVGAMVNEHTNPLIFRENGDAWTLTPAVRPWYTFGGWYLDADFTRPVTTLDNTVVTGDITLYAKMTPATYKMYFMNGDTTVAVREFDVTNKTPDAPALPVRHGYTAAWESVTPTPSDMYVQVVFTPIAYSIRYSGMPNGLVNPNPSSYTIENTVTLLALAREGYRFTGWLMGQDSVTVIPAGTTGEITLTPCFEAVSYTVTYDNVYGADTSLFPGSFTVESASVTLPTSLVREGYTFLGWSAGGVSVSEIAKGTVGNVVLSARWALKEYTISYLGLVPGARNPNPTTFTIESAITLAAPSADGFSFHGWKMNGEDIAEIPLGTVGDIVLTADFTAYTYTISYENLQGASSDGFRESYTAAETVALPVGIKGDGVTLTGWILGDKTVTEIPAGTTGNLTLTAVWSPESYRINYEGLLPTDENPNPSSFTKLDTVSLASPIRAGYTFSGWKMNGTPISEIPAGTKGEITLTAAFSPISYTITYLDTRDTDISAFRASYTVEDGSFALPTNLAYLGESFQGWLLDGKLVSEIPAGTTGNLVLTAKWVLESYRITYAGLLPFDTNQNPASYTVKDRVELAAPARAGYRFLGWQLDGEYVTFLAAGSVGDVTLTACFEVVNYRITYANLFGADVSSLPTEFTVNSDAITLPTSLSADGRRFLGWEWNGSYIREIAHGSVGDMTVTAVWETISYPITYEGLLAADRNENPTSYTVSDTVVLAAPVREGYTFLGWTMGGDRVTEIAQGTTGALTLTASFEPTVYKITYGNMAGVNTESFPSEYTVLTGAIALPTGLTSPAGTFLGWEWDGESVTEIPADAKGDIHLTAVWETVRYTISYFGLEAGDSNPNPSSYTIAETVTLQAPIRLGYTFLGWTRNGTPISEIPAGTTGTVNLTAAFVPTEYHISYTNTKGVDTSTFPARYTAQGGAVVLPVLEAPAGFVFLHWELPDGTKISEIPAGSMGDFLLTAVFSPTSYTVTLHAMGGTLLSNRMTVNVDEPYYLPVPVKEGYAFVGWFLNTGDDAGAMTGSDGASLSAYPYGSDRIFYARYTPIKYSIRFVTNGGNVLPLGSYSHGECFRPGDHIAAIGTGAYFAGWYTADGATEYTATTRVESDVTLYAKWLESTPIGNMQDFLAIAQNPAGTYHLTNDITFSGNTFDPIPEFSGILDGNGFAIRAFTMDNNFTSAAYAMFVKNTGTIKNLTVRDFSYTFNVNSPASMNAGILTATNEGVIENCFMDGADTMVMVKIDFTTRGTTSNVYWGVLSGANKGTIRGCENTVPVDYSTFSQVTNSENYRVDSFHTNYYLGGFVGINEASGVITSSRSQQVITLSGSTAKHHGSDDVAQYLYIAAAVGLNRGLCTDGYADLTLNLTSSGNVYTNGGGFVGRNEGSIANSSAIGSIDISCGGGSQIGGFVGYNVGADAVIRGSHSALTISQSGTAGNVGGFVGRNDAKVMTSYASGDVASASSPNSGGFVGYSNDGSTISQSFCMGNVQKPSGATGSFVGAHGTTSVTYRCYYLSNATLVVGGVHIEHTTENKNVVGKTYIELLSEELLIGSLEWNDGDWILLFDETPILAWEKDIGHSYEITVVEPDCENFGYSVYSCTHCGRFFLADFVEAWGHTYDVKDATVVAPTCSTAGYTSHACRVCGDEVRTDPTEPRQHESNGSPVHLDSTCTDAGYDRYTCALCGETYDTVIAPLGHAPVQTAPYQAPTCGLSSLGEYYATAGHTAELTCSVCDEIVQPSTEIAPHKYALTETKTAPTCTTDGFGTFKCEHANCGHTKSEAIPMTGHADENHDGCCDTCRTFIGLEGVTFIEIYTAEDLLQITQNPYGAYRLMADIDLGGKLFTPLCSERSPFMGYFDGNGKKILNLYCGDVDRGGFFDTIGTYGIVRQLTISGVEATLSHDGIFGAIAATNMGVIVECTVTDEITFTLSSALSVSTRDDYAKSAIATFGGVVGENRGISAKLYGCTVSGTMSVSAKNCIDIGVKNGILDYILRNYSAIKSTVSVTAGALAGVNEASIEDCTLALDEYGYLVGSVVTRPDAYHQFGFAHAKVIMELGQWTGVNRGTITGGTGSATITELDWSVQPTYICKTWSNEHEIVINKQ